MRYASRSASITGPERARHMTDALLPEARAVIGRVARTFALATRFLPADLRDDVSLLYLVCRTLDNLVDTRQPEAARRLGEVQRWAQGVGPAVGREEAILAGLCCRYPSFPRQAIVDFCEGQLADLGEVRIETEAELDLHAYRVAGTVGLMLAALLGINDERATGPAIALGIAMQRTNILRDIDEDLAMGRVYLPAETLEELGIGDLERDDRTKLLRREIAIADRWYETGIAGTRQLVRGGWQVRAAGLMYREILRELERGGLGRVRPARVSVGRTRKLVLLGVALLAASPIGLDRFTSLWKRSGLKKAAQDLQMPLYSSFAPSMAAVGIDEQGDVRQRIDDAL